MEYGLETANKLPTLMDAFREWNRSEDMFREAFGDGALEDRDFLKLKLREYDRIWHTFNGKPLSKDEKALMVILRFQRRKLRRGLYRGLLTRFLNRAGSYIRFLLQVRRTRAVPTQVGDHRYLTNTPGLVKEGKDNDQQKQEERYQRKYNNHDLGPKRKTDRGYRQSM